MASDEKTIELLEKLHNYQLLTNSYRQSFISGFQDLARANFQTSERIKIGKDAYDLRPCLACTIAEAQKEANGEPLLTIVDKLKERNMNGNEHEQYDADGDHDVDHDIVAGDDIKQQVKNRKRKNVQTKEVDQGVLKDVPEEVNEKTDVSYDDKNEEASTVLFRDPINQFGAIPPATLRKSQSHFKEALLQAVEIINLQRSIQRLITQLELEN